jgi:hypothetical protein
MTQKDAVFFAVTQTLTSNNVSFTANSTDVSSVLNRDLRSKINSVLVDQFKTGAVEISDEAKSKLNDTAALRAYVSGLVSNWVRKDPRLNGGSIIATTNPTSSSKKQFKSDPQLKAMRILLSTQVDQTKRDEIEAFISARVATLSN